MKAPRQSAALNPLGSGFDRFLYADVGADRHGGLLSVVSALARVGVDPWEQAAMLARLPVDAAVRALSALLARLPVGSGKPVDPIPVATRLVTLLPHGSAQPASLPGEVARIDSRIAANPWLMAMLYLVGMLLFLGVQHLLEPQPAAAPAPLAAPAPPVNRLR